MQYISLLLHVIYVAFYLFCLSVFNSCVHNSGQIGASSICSCNALTCPHFVKCSHLYLFNVVLLEDQQTVPHGMKTDDVLAKCTLKPGY